MTEDEMILKLLIAYCNLWIQLGRPPREEEIHTHPEAKTIFPWYVVHFGNIESLKEATLQAFSHAIVFPYNGYKDYHHP